MKITLSRLFLYKLSSKELDIYLVNKGFHKHAIVKSEWNYAETKCTFKQIGVQE